MLHFVIQEALKIGLQQLNIDEGIYHVREFEIQEND